jgi:hypothetical protein
MNEEQLNARHKVLSDKLAELKCKTCGPGRYYIMEMAEIRRKLSKLNSNLKIAEIKE